MKRALTWLSFFGSVTLALAAAEGGKPPPAFTASEINGKSISLSDYKGKIVVLESYNIDCPFCHNHYRTGAMQDLQKDLTAKGVVFLVVNSVNPHNPSPPNTEAPP